MHTCVLSREAPGPGTRCRFHTQDCCWLHQRCFAAHTYGEDPDISEPGGLRTDISQCSENRWTDREHGDTMLRSRCLSGTGRDLSYRQWHIREVLATSSNVEKHGTVANPCSVSYTH